MKLRIVLASTAIALCPLPATAAPLIQQSEVQAESVPTTTSAGTRYSVADGWTQQQEGDVVTLAPPEPGSTIRLVEIGAADSGKDAIQSAWQLVDPEFERPIQVERDIPAENGWDEMYMTAYRVPPAEARAAQAIALRKDDRWTVVLVDLEVATAAKRGAQLGEIFGAIAPSAYAEEVLLGKDVRAVDAAFVSDYRDWLKSSMETLHIPGAAFALIGKDGRILHEEGLGVRDIKSGKPVDTDTLFMVGSNTKGMTTLMIGSMVEDGLIDYDRKVIEYDPQFKLGSAETTDKVLVRHLICACTGLPRKDLEWVINTPADADAAWTYSLLAETEPTSGFGEVFQYNNVIAAAAGYVAAHVLYPDIERGAAYDRAMQERVFGPLGMDDVTFDTDEALASGDVALFHGIDGEGNAEEIAVAPNRAIYPVRPAGAAWADIDDFARYVANELTAGVAPDGTRVFAEDAVLDRRAHGISMGKDAWYGMGVMSSEVGKVPVTFHGGTTFGHQSQYMVIPDAGVAMAILTNSSAGGLLANLAQRKLVEMLYDAEEEKADAALADAAKNGKEALERFWSRVQPVGDRGEALVGTYANDALGVAEFRRDGEDWVLELASFASPVMLRENDDDTASLVMTGGGWRGTDFLIGESDGGTTLTLDDGQHQYVYTRSAPSGS